MLTLSDDLHQTLCGKTTSQHRPEDEKNRVATHRRRNPSRCRCASQAARGHNIPDLHVPDEKVERLEHDLFHATVPAVIEHDEGGTSTQEELGQALASSQHKETADAHSVTCTVLCWCCTTCPTEHMCGGGGRGVCLDFGTRASMEPVFGRISEEDFPWLPKTSSRDRGLNWKLAGTTEDVVLQVSEPPLPMTLNETRWHMAR